MVATGGVSSVIVENDEGATAADEKATKAEVQDRITPRFRQARDGSGLPHLQRRLLTSGALSQTASALLQKGREAATSGDEVWYQRPPTLGSTGTLGPVRPTARDAEYGHQDGELNFWMPLTDPEQPRTTLWVSRRRTRVIRSAAASLGQIAVFGPSRTPRAG